MDMVTVGFLSSAEWASVCRCFFFVSESGDLGTKRGYFILNEHSVHTSG